MLGKEERGSRKTEMERAMSNDESKGTRLTKNAQGYNVTGNEYIYILPQKRITVTYVLRSEQPTGSALETNLSTGESTSW